MRKRIWCLLRGGHVIEIWGGIFHLMHCTRCGHTWSD